MINSKTLIFIALILGLSSSVIRADSRMGLTPDEVAFVQSLFQSDNKSDLTNALAASPSSQKVLA